MTFSSRQDLWEVSWVSSGACDVYLMDIDQLNSLAGGPVPSYYMHYSSTYATVIYASQYFSLGTALIVFKAGASSVQVTFTGSETRFL